MANVQEIWKDIPGYEGYYQASDLGRIRSLDRMMYPPHTKETLRKGKIISPSINPKGYNIIGLYKDGKGKYTSVHRLITTTVLGKSDLHIDHIDGNKINNRLDNLRYCTVRENNTFRNWDRSKGFSSSFVGVHKSRTPGVWLANIYLNNKSIYLGRFKNEDEAAEAYQYALSMHLSKI
jgi:hypothetical protein